MIESSVSSHSTARHARPLLPAVRTPRIRPLVQPAPESAAGEPHTRRPDRHRPPRTADAPRTPLTPHSPHPAEAPRRPRNPRSACAPAPGTPGHAVRGRPPVPTGRAELAARFAHRLVEVLTGARPAGQLQRHTTLDGYGQLTALVRSGPLRPRGEASRPRLGRVHDSAPSAQALEVCVLVEIGARHHMVAFRLELHRRTGQWQCAAVETR